jgi:hypothetical protein
MSKMSDQIDKVRTGVRTNPTKFADVRLCLRTPEMRLRGTTRVTFSAVFRIVHAAAQ